MTGAGPSLRENPSASRYELELDGQLVGLIDYRLRGQTIELFHTEIDPERRRGGLGGMLVSFALEDAKARGLRVLPTCPFVAAYIREHGEEYGGLVEGR